MSEELERKPHERIYTPDEIMEMDAKAPPLAYRDIQGRNDRHYEEHATGVMAFLQMPRRLSEVNEWATTCKPRIPSKLAEEVVFWLELKGKVIREKGNGSATYRAATPERLAAIARLAGKKGDDMWITREEAEKILGVAGSWFYVPTNTKDVNRKKEGNAYLYERASVVALAARREGSSQVMVEARKSLVAKVIAGKQRGNTVRAAPVARTPEKPDDYRAHILWVTCGVTLGEFTPEEALKRIEALSVGQ